MTIATTISRMPAYVGNGVTTSFAYNFEILSKTELGVYILTTASGVETKKVVDTHYTIAASGILNPAGGNVVFLVAPLATEQVILLRETTQTQSLDLATGVGIPAESLEDELDRLTLLCQELKEKLDRASLLKLTTSLANLEFPAPGAGMYIKWNAAGTALEASSVVTPGTLTVSAYIQTLLDDANAVVAQTTLGLSALARTLVALTTSETMRATLMVPNRNFLINGECIKVSGINTALLFTYAQGPVHGILARGDLLGGPPSSGTIKQDTASAVGQSGYSLFLDTVTTDLVYTCVRVESILAAQFKNKTASVQCRVLNDVATNDLRYFIRLSKANAKDNFAAVTQINQSSAQTVASATDTLIKYENVSMGDCSNGIQLEIFCSRPFVAPIVNNNFRFTEYKLELGAVATGFETNAIDASSVQGAKPPVSAAVLSTDANRQLVANTGTLTNNISGNALTATTAGSATTAGDSDTVDTRHASYLLNRANHTGVDPASADASIHAVSSSAATSVLNTDTWKDLDTLTVPNVALGASSRTLICATVSATNSVTGGQMQVRMTLDGALLDAWTVTYPASPDALTFTISQEVAIATTGAGRVIKVQAQGVAGRGDSTLIKVSINAVVTVQ